jgi:preprotein translocase subunit Sss1
MDYLKRLAKKAKKIMTKEYVAAAQRSAMGVLLGGFVAVVLIMSLMPTLDQAIVDANLTGTTLTIAQLIPKVFVIVLVIAVLVQSGIITL